MCHMPNAVRLNKEEYIVRSLDKFLVTSARFAQVKKEVKGFARGPFNTFLGRDEGDATPLTLARSGVLGGTREYLEVASAVFDVILTATLSKGLLGTEENILR